MKSECDDQIPKYIFYEYIVPWVSKFGVEPKCMIRYYEGIAELCIERAKRIRVANAYLQAVDEDRK